MIVEDIRALLNLKQYPKPTPEQKSRAKGHMQQLRRAGFTNRDIFLLSNGFWKEHTIKQYLKGEKTVDTTERDTIMQTIVGFINSGLTLEDVNTTLSRYEVLKNDVTAEDEVRLIQASKQGVDLQQLSNTLRKLRPKDILTVTRILQNLDDQGWYIESLDLIKEVTNKHGGPDNALKALLAMGSLKEMQEEQKKAEQITKNKIDEAIAKNQEITRLNTEILAIKTYVEMSKILIEQYSYDLNSIKTLMNFAKKYGPPWEALEAINKYNQIQEMDDTIKNQKIEATKNRDEIANTKAKLDEIQQTTNDAYTALGEVEGKLDEVAVTQGLHDILIDPKKAQLTKNEFLNTAYAVADGLIKYTESKSVELSDWQDCKRSLEYIRSRTTKLIGKE